MSSHPSRLAGVTATQQAAPPRLHAPPGPHGLTALARWWLLPVGGAVVALATCLIASGTPGFPEDDAWIHQDFARTLALTGHLAFQPGGSGAGSTSPLWVLLLAPLHLVTHGSAPVWVVVGWSALLGGLALAGLGVLSGMATAALARRAGASPRQAQILAGLAGLCVVGEWQLIWAALSGMETNLFAFLTLLLIVAASRHVRPLWLGLLAGVTIWARPEGALLALLVLAGAAWEAIAPAFATATRERRAQLAAALRRLGPWCLRWALPFAVGMVVCVIPYLALNLVASGHLLPSTVYAKFAGVAPAGGRLAQLRDYIVQMGIVLAVVNPMLVVVAALLGGHWLARRISIRRAGAAPSPTSEVTPTPTSARQVSAFPLATLLWLWPLALAALYAPRLPGAWQYGRYLMPALPPLLALACARLRFLLRDTRPRIAPVAGVLFLLAAVVSFGGARQLYTSNVQGINNYHVAVALWLRAHTPPGTLVATHDIGAIGYFSDRPVVDFAGLANPELIPLLNNQAALENALKQRHVAYVAMKQDWFPPPNLMLHDLAGHEVYRACGLGFCFVVYQTGW